MDFFVISVCLFIIALLLCSSRGSVIMAVHKSTVLDSWTNEILMK